MSYNPNGYNQNTTDMLTWFYPTSQPHNLPNQALTTNFRISNVDISNNYTGIRTNSAIPVSTLYNIGYSINSQNIGDLFELNLPVFDQSLVLNIGYKIFPPGTGQGGNDGLLIQYYLSTTLSFNYVVDCSFVIIGGGGGGGNTANGNAGGGGGAGELITGSIQNCQPGIPLTFTIGQGGSVGGGFGGNTSISYQGNTITANGGGAGGGGKGSTSNTIGSSSGGSGSYSHGSTNPGTVTPRTIPNTSIFTSMTSFGNGGSQGNDQDNDTGAGGGGGGTGGASPDPGNESPGVGGAAKEIVFGRTTFYLGGGGGGGARQAGYGAGGGVSGGDGGSGVGGNGGGYLDFPTGFPSGSGFTAASFTGSGGGGANNNQSNNALGGGGSSGTVIFYILPSGVSLP